MLLTERSERFAASDRQSAPEVRIIRPNGDIKKNTELHGSPRGMCTNRSALLRFFLVSQEGAAVKARGAAGGWLCGAA